MSEYDEDAPPEPPIAAAVMVYTGPVAPHWEVHFDSGDSDAVDALRDRVMARLMLLPPHDPQFKRNRERVKRDAERENITITWDPPELDVDPPPREPAPS